MINNISLVENFINFYGRRVSHLTPLLENLLKNDLPKYEVLIKENNISFFNNLSLYKKLNLEIGFGSGDFIYNSALKNPDDFYLGIEVFLNGICSLLKKLQVCSLDNLKIFNKNVYLILNLFANQFFDNIFILFPDPWHKSRHHKRRIINQNNLDTFYKILKSQGRLYFATDYKEYAEYTLREFKNNKNFEIKYSDINDALNCPWSDFSTKYQQKALNKNSDIYYFTFYKR